MKKYALTPFTLLAVASFVACGSPTDDEPTPTPSSLVSTLDEPAGDNCVFGGLAVVSGVDTNGDGELGEAEVTTVSYVCNGAKGNDGGDGDAGENGAPSLVETEDATTCDAERGGVVVKVGTDTNLDGVLQEGEVTSSRTVCNGTDASIGPVLIGRATIEAGTVCGGGGTALQVGHDADADGVLDLEEVESEIVECGPCPIDFATDPQDATQCVAVRTVLVEGYFDDVIDPDGLNPGVAVGERFVARVQYVEPASPTDTNPDGSVGTYQFTDAPTSFTVELVGAKIESAAAADVTFDFRNDFGFVHQDEYVITSNANKPFYGVGVQAIAIAMYDHEGTAFSSDGFRGPLTLANAEQAYLTINFGDTTPPDNSMNPGPGPGPIGGGGPMATAIGTITNVDYR